VHTVRPFLLSVAIHAALGALLVGALFSVQKRIPLPPEKIALKLFEPPQEDSQPLRPAAVPEPIFEPIPLPKPQQSIPKPLQTAPVQTKPFAQPHTPAAPAPVVAPKTVEPAPAAPIKATPPPPPPPKIEENYAEEHLGRIRTILNERKTYPKNARRLNQQGDVTVTFTLSTQGEASAITITESSGFDLLDNAAKELIISCASEFPKPKKSVRISVPIGYKLR
jgi:periplasmic protein TonB